VHEKIDIVPPMRMTWPVDQLFFKSSLISWGLPFSHFVTRE